MLLLKCFYRVKLLDGLHIIRGSFGSFSASKKSSGDVLLNAFQKRSQNTRAGQDTRLCGEQAGRGTRASACQIILQHFDEQYSTELGQQWSSARSVLLNPHCWQYGVLLNRFSDLTDVKSHLKSLGYYNLLPETDCPTSQGESHLPRLQCLVHKDAVHLSSQRHRPGWLKQYYLLNAASLLPVLALGLRDGERVLDLCSAPGGKALALLQAVTPGLLHCNEADKSRYEWLKKTLESYVPPQLRETITVTNEDGRDIGSSKPATYDKVLVDAPCSNDRSWLYTPTVQQGELWLRERAQLPHLQKELICSALAVVRPGGWVVYSTCTMSCSENQSVVEAVLTSCPGVELLDLEEELIGSLSIHFAFARLQPPLGYLVIPEHGRTWGPMFVCRLRRSF